MLEREMELALLAQTDCCGVSLPQCLLLLEVADWKEGSIGDLAAALEVDPSTLSRTADSLVKAGLLSRRDDPANRRRQILALTIEGEGKVQAIDTLCDGFYGDLLATLPADKVAAVTEAIPVLGEALKKARLSGLPACCGRGGKP
jgi:DNA-binding MarR family transcriptional regulator